MTRLLLSKLPEGEDGRDLREATLTALGLAGVLAGWVWLFASASLAPYYATNPAHARMLLPAATMVAASTASLLAARLRLPWRAIPFLLGMGASFLAAYQLTWAVMWLYYLSLVVIVAGLLVGAAASFAAALILTVASALVLRVGVSWPSLQELLPAMGLLWAAALTSWLSSRSLFTALHWALHSQQQASRLLEELRQRQGQLNRTLEALTEASRRLERTNQELGVARQRAEEARALKEQFVANVSHELRTPLNLIVGFAEMMYLSPESYGGATWTPALEGDIHEVYRASRHLQGLINDILDLSRIDASRLPMFRELQDIRAIIADAAETVHPLLRQRGLSYQAHWPEELPQLFVDRTRIRQVLLNLFNNAIRYTEQGGITATVELTREAVVVAIRDTGIGISADQLESVFEEFRQLDAGLRRTGGAGLGLALSRQFVELHGGRMWAASELGRGSTFYFSLPLPGAVPQTARLQQIPNRPRPDVAAGPIVVVDPDPTIGEMLSRYLEDRHILAAADTGEAEALVEAEHPQAVIVNQRPEALAEEWIGPLGRQSGRYSVPVLRCSIPSPSWLRGGSGFDECLAKPVSRDMLSHLLAQRCPQPARVLVVDDDPGFVRLMARMLATSDRVREVVSAYSGAQALRLAREKAPDLVLLDLLMPEVDGFEVLRALRADPACRATAVVAVTATSYAEEALLRHGTQLTLAQAKGISTGTLVELLTAVLKVVHPDYAIANGAEGAGED